ncbi:MAG: cytochrome c [Gemmatimonadetes bacterium]|jgi:mono/diheme cytochrome c family protein|nr:cytochrome c [Gemmatimonadota bacterium]
MFKSRSLIAMLALMTLAGCKPLDDGMVMIFGRSMRDSRSFDPYENPRGAPEGSFAFASGNYPARPGEVNLGQPEGVMVPRITQADLGTPGVGSTVVQGLVNPMSRDDARSQARGEELYLRTCVVCHGPDGVGANAYIAAKHPVLPAYNLSGATVAAYSDQYLYTMIRVGRGLMPEYGSRITEFDRWSVVNYVRQLQEQAGNALAGGAE